MAKFAIVLNNPPGRYKDLDEDTYMSIIKDYVAWVEKTTAQGIYQGGQKLTDQAGKVIRSKGDGLEIHDSPFLEASEVLGGFMLIEANDMESALEIVSDHPHLKYKCSMEIYQVEENA